MKLRVMSDLHLEGQPYQYKFGGEDILLLVGDIHTHNRHQVLLKEVPEHVQIVMVPGNHEYYHEDIVSVNRYLGELEDDYPNFNFLNNSSTSINGVEFFGGQMCTDFMLYGISHEFIAKSAATSFINDFRIVRKTYDSSEMWTVEDHCAEYKTFVQELACWLDRTEGKKRVVMSHFVPHPKMIHPHWGGVENALNPYFTCDLERYMGWDGLWVCGHTHDASDIMIGDTRLICNPRGYRGEDVNFDDCKIVEI